MNTKKLHYFAGVFILLYTSLHLFNHLLSIVHIQTHIDFMEVFRVIYRNIFVETLLLISILFQIISGIILFIKKRKMAQVFFDKLQIYTGLYLAFFFLMHISAVLVGRFVLKVDTNFYYGAAGLNTFPHLLFFIPYYGLAILSFFGHLSAVHTQKMKKKFLGFSSKQQAYMILGIGAIVTIIIFIGMTYNVNIPNKYAL